MKRGRPRKNDLIDRVINLAKVEINITKKMVSEKLSLTPDTVNSLLHRMLSYGQLRRVVYGVYALPSINVSSAMEVKKLDNGRHYGEIRTPDGDVYYLFYKQ